MEKLILTHSLRDLYQRCQRKYLFSAICGLKGLAPEGAGLDFGKCFHLASEHLDKWDDFESAMELFSQNFLSEDKVRTLGRAKELLLAYRKVTQQAGLRFKFNQDGIEKPFMVELEPWLIHAGRLDREMESSEEFGEIKTTYYLYSSQGSPMPYLSQWIDHNSIVGYAFYRGFKKCHLIACGVYPQKHGSSCITFPIEIFPWRLEEWRRDTLQIGKEIFNVFIGNNFEQNFESKNLEVMIENRTWERFGKTTSQCNPWPYSNPCVFRDLCIRNVPESLLRSQYVVEPFRSWEVEED